MMRTADLTVAVATLDRPQGLARCLEALALGTVQPAEVIVVDQGEGGAEVVEAFRERLPVRHLRQERRGLAASRNLALAEACQPVLAVTDDDCVPDVGWVAALEHAFRSLPPGRGRVGSGGRLGGGSSEGDDLVASAQHPPPNLPPFPTAPSQGGGTGGTHPPDAVTGRVLPLGPEQPGLYAVSSRTSLAPADFAGRALPWLVGTGGNFAARRDWLLRAGGFDERLGAGSPGGSGEDMDILY
ncbi:MAG TPA: glycosyltransferase family A protein, partial [Thermoanaerobaculia bacterium]|nr:glycosyltransferase family A protein [Thermoanaerobaculia bacterium]